MGLTSVPGADHLFTSGHPVIEHSTESPGLTESSAGGHTGTRKSLIGQVNFHTLATNGDLLIGFDGVTGLLSHVELT
ncbi:hypothetical protein [Nocardia sputi]|uniref:hypothetical protein n=1 Tax=Nocardia sputi TaxID=2943705 RepID=UPI0020BE405A|nr:hypothetical protein [Nocardia sputi]